MNHKPVWALYALLVVLSITDYLITATIIHHTGMAAEANWVMRTAAMAWGVHAMLWIKLAGLASLGGCIALLPTYRYRVLGWTLGTIDALFALNLVWSAYVLAYTAV